MTSNDDKYEQLKKIRDDVLNLQQSPLYQYRRKNGYKPVIGQGNHNAKVMFIGEAPGENEAKTGVPFCGAAGRVLSELLTGINLQREDVYVTNIVKDRPPQNRDPSPQEIELYAPFLLQQIRLISPSIIATLGRFSMEFVMREMGLEGKIEKISLIHGKVFVTPPEHGSRQVIPMLHPAVALYNGSQKKVLADDFEILSAALSLI